MKQENLLEIAKDLIVALEQGDEAAVDGLLDKLTELRETQLFNQIGKLTRQLHDTLVSFSVDAKVASMTETEIPDAKERLHYVIEMTEQAADRTLTVVEDLLPISQSLNEQVESLSGKWSRFLDREMPLDEFKAMTGEITTHFQQSKGGLEHVQQGLTDILLAQGFQDITGQIIRRVINLVEELEHNLVKVISISSGYHTDSHYSSSDQQDLPGPVVPGVDDRKGDVAHNQVDVDDLLSSLGF